MQHCSRLDGVNLATNRTTTVHSFIVSPLYKVSMQSCGVSYATDDEGRDAAEVGTSVYAAIYLHNSHQQQDDKQLNDPAAS